MFKWVLKIRIKWLEAKLGINLLLYGYQNEFWIYKLLIKNKLAINNMEEFEFFEDADIEQQFGVVRISLNFDEVNLNRDSILNFVQYSFECTACLYPDCSSAASWIDEANQKALCSKHARFTGGNFNSFEATIIKLKDAIIGVEYDLIYLQERYLFILFAQLPERLRNDTRLNEIHHEMNNIKSSVEYVVALKDDPDNWGNINLTKKILFLLADIK